MNRCLLLVVIFVYGIFSVTPENATSFDREIRENPQFFTDTTREKISCESYKYLKLADNKINYNGNDWSFFYNKLKGMSDTISIVHIGDSHLQADIATGYIRTLFQNNFGNAGRGIVIPFKLSRTNEPRDYSITSNTRWIARKAINSANDEDMGFTGIAISPMEDKFNLKISLLSKKRPESFKKLQIFHAGKIQVDSLLNMDFDADYRINYSDNITEIILSDNQSSVTLCMSRTSDVFIYGISLTNESPGVVYNVIGNNGATFSTYNKIPDFGKNISSLKPSLVIISLGTNDAFGNISSTCFYNEIDALVKDIQKHNENSKLLLVTPMECHRRKYVRIKGRKRRRRTHVVNDKVSEHRNLIIEYAKHNNIAVYDWYDIAGGEDVAQKWISDNLMSRDHIHNTPDGYNIQGYLLFEALTKDLNIQQNLECK